MCIICRDCGWFGPSICQFNDTCAFLKSTTMHSATVFINARKIKRSISRLSTYPFFMSSHILQWAHGSSECQAFRLMRSAAAFLPNHQFNWKTQNRTLTKRQTKCECVLLIPFPFQSPSGWSSSLIVCWPHFVWILSGLYLLINDILNLFANKWHAIFFKVKYRSYFDCANVFHVVFWTQLDQRCPSVFLISAPCRFDNIKTHLDDKCGKNVWLVANSLSFFAINHEVLIYILSANTAYQVHFF